MKKGYAVVLIISFCLVFCLVCDTPSHAQSKAISLKFSTFFPAPHKKAILLTEFGKELEKRTNGRVKVEVYPGGILTPPAQTFDNVMKGIADGGESVLSYTPGRFPLMEVVDLPLGIPEASTGTKMTMALYKKFKPKELDGVHMLYFWSCGPKMVCTKQPVDALEKLKGLKLRGTGVETAVIETLGATPVGMSMGEAYDAVSKGVVNGLFIPRESLEGFKHAEVVNYCTPFESAPLSTGYMFMNKKKYDALPKDIQLIIDKLGNEWADREGTLWDEMDASGAKFFAQKGGKVITLSQEENARWKKQTEPLLNAYVEKMKAKGLPGKEALKFCEDFVKKPVK